jgi:hypothetical protein
MGAIAWRMTKALFIHLAILAVALGLIYLAAQGQESLSAEVRARYQGRSPLALLTVLSDARGELMMWAGVGLLASWLCTSLFVISAERAQPCNDREAASRIGLWSGLLLVALSLQAFYGWLNLLRAGVSGELTPSTFMVAVAVGLIATVVAYWLATGLVVRRVMRPSVPLAAVLPTRWS